MKIGIVLSLASMILSLAAVILAITSMQIHPVDNDTILTRNAVTKLEPVKDEEIVFGEIKSDDIAGMGLAMRDAMIGGQGKFKWVEARGKKDGSGMLQIICHTTKQSKCDKAVNAMQ